VLTPLAGTPPPAPARMSTPFVPLVAANPLVSVSALFTQLLKQLLTADSVPVQEDPFAAAEAAVKGLKQQQQQLTISIKQLKEQQQQLEQRNSKLQQQLDTVNAAGQAAYDRLQEQQQQIKANEEYLQQTEKRIDGKVLEWASRKNAVKQKEKRQQQQQMQLEEQKLELQQWEQELKEWQYERDQRDRFEAGVAEKMQLVRQLKKEAAALQLQLQQNLQDAAAATRRAEVRTSGLVRCLSGLSAPLLKLLYIAGGEERDQGGIQACRKGH
jgi:chromosome segregation ATPase